MDAIPKAWNRLREVKLSMGDTIYLESTRLKKRVTPRVEVPSS
jgi:hypothetical protein